MAVHQYDVMSLEPRRNCKCHVSGFNCWNHFLFLIDFNLFFLKKGTVKRWPEITENTKLILSCLLNVHRLRALENQDMFPFTYVLTMSALVLNIRHVFKRKLNDWPWIQSKSPTDKPPISVQKAVCRPSFQNNFHEYPPCNPALASVSSVESFSLQLASIHWFPATWPAVQQMLSLCGYSVIVVESRGINNVAWLNAVPGVLKVAKFTNPATTHNTTEKTLQPCLVFLPTKLAHCDRRNHVWKTGFLDAYCATNCCVNRSCRHKSQKDAARVRFTSYWLFQQWSQFVFTLPSAELKRMAKIWRKCPAK